MNYGIIAAGKGERLTSEGISLPKPLVAPAGEPLIRRLIRIMSMPGGEAAMTRLGVIVREPEIAGSVREACASLGIDAPLDLTVKATADSMLSFAEVTGRFKGDFIVTTVDTVFEQSEMIRLAEAFAARTDADGYMGVSEYADDEKPLWVSTDADGYITAFTDRRRDDSRYVSAGVYCLPQTALECLAQCRAAGITRMRHFQRALLDKGLRLRAWPMGKVVDVDHAADIDAARQIIESDNDHHQHGRD
ncbi:sugar phosphate nucleotidyltransferase [Paramuribaculum intestinale]|uniref:sugar phosphate nucleotidyltransferase n=1 Tax=Paramuribaculum intestinale TaxID=2094151 RepID=UPI0025B702F5|nr:sugar phosphate nucleotidyltransferase [Paramuribaculum intestinale]